MAARPNRVTGARRNATARLSDRSGGFRRVTGRSCRSTRRKAFHANAETRRWRQRRAGDSNTLQRAPETMAQDGTGLADMPRLGLVAAMCALGGEIVQRGYFTKGKVILKRMSIGLRNARKAEGEQDQHNSEPAQGAPAPAVRTRFPAVTSRVHVVLPKHEPSCYPSVIRRTLIQINHVKSPVRDQILPPATGRSRNTSNDWR